MRKTVLAIAAAMALGTATIVTGATAAPHGGGGGGGGHFAGGGGGGHFGGGGAHFGGGPNIGGGAHFNGGANFAAAPHAGRNFAPGVHGNFAVGHNHGSFAFNHYHGHLGFRGHHFRGGFYGPGIGLYAYGGMPWGYSNCWQDRWVWTPYGYHWRVVDVCAWPYD